MAVTPDEIMMAKLSEHDQKVFEKLERIIDASLRANFNGTSYTYSSDDLGKASNRVIDALIDLYKKAGWYAACDSDLHADSSMTFQKKGLASSGHSFGGTGNYYDDH